MDDEMIQASIALEIEERCNYHRFENLDLTGLFTHLSPLLLLLLLRGYLVISLSSKI